MTSPKKAKSPNVSYSAPLPAAIQSNYPLPPTKSDAPILDRRAAFSSKILPQKTRSKLEKNFLLHKLKLLRTHPGLHPLDRSRMVEETEKRLNITTKVRPVPGGVGYGMFYGVGFKTSFAMGTAISWEVVCPTVPGGSVTKTLYLTATNRSSMGVEALIAYDGNQQFSFAVFDWARPENDRWQVPMTFAELTPYLGGESTHGLNCQVIGIINSTYQQQPGQWVNEVLLLDNQQHQWHLVYQNSYQATLQDQTAGLVGSWGPIVEAFEDVYSGTSVMGALNTQILTRDSLGNWSQWTQLTSVQSVVRVDNKGFVPVFLDPNFSWSVHS